MNNGDDTIIPPLSTIIESGTPKDIELDAAPPIDPDMTQQHLRRLIVLGAAVWVLLVSMYIARQQGYWTGGHRGNLIDGAAFVWPFFYGFIIYTEWRRKRDEKNTLTDERKIKSKDRHTLYK